MEVFFSQHPDVVIASNRFIGVSTILQFENTPLIEVGKFVKAGYSAKFSVYHSDGTKIAVVKGRQIYRTEEGKAAKFSMRYDHELTACELEGKPILELRRDGPAALRGWAQLYAPEGFLVEIKPADSVTPVLLPKITDLLRNESLTLPGNAVLERCTFSNFMIGMLVCRPGYVPPDGSIAVRIDIPQTDCTTLATPS